MQGSGMYQEVILDHYRNPRRWGRLSSVSFSHTGENSSCGDELTFDLRFANEERTNRSTSDGKFASVGVA